jgi:hypothetical protein
VKVTTARGDRARPSPAILADRHAARARGLADGLAAAGALHHTDHRGYVQRDHQRPGTGRARRLGADGPQPHPALHDRLVFRPLAAAGPSVWEFRDGVDTGQVPITPSEAIEPTRAAIARGPTGTRSSTASPLARPTRHSRRRFAAPSRPTSGSLSGSRRRDRPLPLAGRLSPYRRVRARPAVETIVKSVRLDLAESALHAPQASWGGVEFNPSSR